jgi:sugar/nucleoside kinase (ribokinase family)
MTMRPLAVVGNVNVDLIMGPTKPWPVPGTEVNVEHDELRPGGSAGNTALAWAGLGVPFVIASSVGADAFGQWLRNALAPHSGGWSSSTRSTAISVGLTHPGDERTFFTTQGHLVDLGWDGVAGQMDGLNGGLLLVCGSFLMEGLARDYPALFDWAAKQDIDIALDPGWPVNGWTKAELARARGWLKHTRHLLINEVEALALSGKANLDTALPALARLMPPDATVVVKAGHRGAFGLQGATRAQAAAPRVAVIDTIGAGDIFNAGYLLAIAEGENLPGAIVAAVDLASRAISTAPRRYERTPRMVGVA